MTTLTFSGTTPISVSRVALRARDAENLARYYRDVVGLEEVGRGGGTITLGAGGVGFLEIEHAPAARPDDPRGAGLFHTAFLLPTRADLARWVRHARDAGLRIDGASDHIASEALYLTDPEGNGIEIYADRPKEGWRRPDGSLALATNPLDFDSLAAEPGADSASWKGAPEGSIVGHVHLRVGDAKAAEAWWTETIGLDTMARYGEAAVFLASGGYHHHIGANMWQSRGAGPREGDRTGLLFVELGSREPIAKAVHADPWGTEIRLVAKS